tara:strand:- start:359 stop:2101 length:1743 start_codon:yes stop_codon:yes gene_type:complete
MVEPETKDAIESTAVSVVEAQQNIVGGTLVGAAGAGVLATPSDSTSQILEQIREIQVQTLRAVRSVADGIMEMVAFDKLQDRRALEDKTENEKEAIGAVPGATPGADVDPGDVDKQTGGFFGFLGALPGAAFFKKLMLPITAFFGKSGLLVKLFGKFGPLGALILGFTLVYKYSDEIAAALAPAIDKLKVLITKMQPLIDFLIKIGDFLIKNILEGIGNALEYVIGAVTRVVDGFMMLFDGDIIGGLKEIFGGLFDFILAIPKAVLETVTNILSPLATAVGDFFKQLYDDIVIYVTDTITNIKNFFIDLKNNIVKFFVDAYEAVKQTIIDAVQGAFNFVADIFNSISDFFSESFKKVKDFVTSLPDKILGFVGNMFSPIIDFFNAIGNRIKQTINGVIDALPLPEFVKKKVRFNIEPTQDQLDNAEAEFAKLEAPEADGTTLKTFPKENFNLKMGVLQNAKNDGPMIFKKQGLAERNAEILTAATGDPYEAINTNKGFMVVNPENSLLPDSLKPPEKVESIARTNVDDIEDVGGSGQTFVVNNNNYNTSNSSVSSQTDVHSGKLDTGIDPYFEKNATNVA